MKNIRYIILLLALAFLSCEGEQATNVVPSDSIISEIEESDTLYELTQEQADSIEFRLLHHYTNNFNFIVKNDSLQLIPREDEVIDTCIVNKGDVIAVADIRANDTVWIKVARDQFTMGWITESELLTGTVPDDNISQIIDKLTGSRAALMATFVVIGLFCFLLRRWSHHSLQIFRFSEMDSFYPIFLLILVSFMACLYASIQNFAPEFWQEYYFHPTLNPFILPPVMATLVTLVWLVIITFIAMVIEVYHHFYVLQGISYIFEMLGVATISYLVISWTTFIYVGYVLLVAYTIVLLWMYFHYIRCRYVCGYCGQRIREKGRCPHCGKLNK